LRKEKENSNQKEVLQVTTKKTRQLHRLRLKRRREARITETASSTAQGQKKKSWRTKKGTRRHFIANLTQSGNEVEQPEYKEESLNKPPPATCKKRGKGKDSYRKGTPPKKAQKKPRD